MHKIYKQNLAEEDLIDIWIYTFKNWGENKADSYLDELESAFNLIAENPYIGNNSDEIRLGYRQYHINRHIIFYRIADKTIHVIRILYDQMDFFKHLKTSN